MPESRYILLLQSAPQMQPESLRRYRKLCEFGDVILAGMDDGAHGFTFATWCKNIVPPGVNSGHYYRNSNLDGAKADFILRSGLFPEDPGCLRCRIQLQRLAIHLRSGLWLP